MHIGCYQAGYNRRMVVAGNGYFLTLLAACHRNSLPAGLVEHGSVWQHQWKTWWSIQLWIGGARKKIAPFGATLAAIRTRFRPECVFLPRIRIDTGIILAV
jgi:hypothetical protein